MDLFSSEKFQIVQNNHVRQPCEEIENLPDFEQNNDNLDETSEKLEFSPENSEAQGENVADNPEVMDEQQNDLGDFEEKTDEFDDFGDFQDDNDGKGNLPVFWLQF